MAGTAKELKATRLRDVEELMVRGVAVRTIVRTIEAQHGLKRATVFRYMKEIRAAWAAEASEIDRTEIRAQHRSRLTKVFERAMTRRTTVRDTNGNVVMEEGPDGRSRPMTVERPDLRTGLRALDSLSKLDNLNDETFKVEGAETMIDMLRFGAALEEKRGGKVPPRRPKSNGANGANGANGHGRGDAAPGLLEPPRRVVPRASMRSLARQRSPFWTRAKVANVPPPGERAQVVLGPDERAVSVLVLGVVRSYPVTRGGRPWFYHRVVLCRVPGDGAPRDLAVERFLAPGETNEGDRP